MNNIEKFNVLTTHILGRLYQRFPVGCPINPDDTLFELKGILDFSSGNDSKEAGRFVGQTLMWLVETGLLIERGKGEGREYVLAPRAFEALAVAVPGPKSSATSAESVTTLGEKMIDATSQVATEIGKEAKKQLAGELVKQFIGWTARLTSSSF